MAKQTFVPKSDGLKARIFQLWKDNKGWQLLGFAVFVFAIGSAVLFYQQNRFVPPRFPDGDSIEQVSAPVPPKPAEVPPTIEESLAIKIVNLESNEGLVRVAIYGNKATFNEVPLALLRKSGAIAENRSTVLVRTSELPDQFAIAVFHDVNSDGELNRSLGIPAEQYGFSRDARADFGPPTYADAVIDRPDPGSSVTITIQ